MSEHGIPAAAKKLAKGGQFVEAVTVTRERTGLTLKDAKDAVDAFVRDPNGASRFSRRRDDLTRANIPPLAITALEEGRLVDAIKHTRTARSLGLKAAKEAVEHFLAQHGDIDARFRAASLTEFRRVVRKLATILVLIGMSAFGCVYWLAA